MPMLLRRLLQMIACVALLAAPACVAENAARRPPRQPSDLRVQTVTVATPPTLLDEDNNGYPDTIPVIVYLWDSPDRYPLPIWDDGALRFELRDDQGNLLAEWVVPPDVVAASRTRGQVGPVHLLSLDIRDATTDARPETKAMLSAQFLSEDGSIAQTTRPLVVRIGA